MLVDNDGHGFGSKYQDSVKYECRLDQSPKAAIHLVQWVLVLRVHRHTHHPTSRRSYLIQQKSVHNRSQSRDPFLAVLESTPPNRFRLRLPFHPQQPWRMKILTAAVSLRYGRSTCPRQICWVIKYGQQHPYRLRFVHRWVVVVFLYTSDPYLHDGQGEDFGPQTKTVQSSSSWR